MPSRRPKAPGGGEGPNAALELVHHEKSKLGNQNKVLARQFS